MNEFEKRASQLTQEMGVILDKAKEENRALSEEERTKYDALKAERDQMEFMAQEERDRQEREAKAKKAATEPVGPGGADPNVTVGETREALQPFAHLGEQLMAVYRAQSPVIEGSADIRLLYQADQETRAATGLSESVPSDGGFLVQKDFNAELLKRTYEVGEISSRVRRIPIGANKNGLKMNAIAESSRADGSRWGGIRAYWMAEAAEKTASKPKFRQVDMSLQKLAALMYATDELLDDAMALGAVVQEGFPEEMNFKVEDAIINGTGAGQPLGIVGCGAEVSVAKETGQAAATIVYDNIVKMWSRMWGRSRRNGIWCINQDCEPQLFKLAIATGTGGAPAFLPAGGLSGSPYSTLFGRPVIPVEYCQTLGTKGDIQFIDPSQYLMIDKGSIKAQSSIHVRFIYDETAFRFVYRVNGQPMWNTTLTPFKGSNTLSPFVNLVTRS